MAVPPQALCSWELQPYSPLTMVSTLSSCTRNQAKEAIWRMKRRGYAVDQHDPAHVAAYMAMRQWTHRVMGDDFAEYLAKYKKDVGTGAKVRTVYWAVPQGNFPSGLPVDLANSLVDDETLKNMELVGGGKVDRDNYYIIDQVVARQALGKNVLIVEMFVGAQLKLPHGWRDRRGGARRRRTGPLAA